MTKRNVTFLFVCASALLTFQVGCKRAEIRGSVRGVDGKPVSGVRVSIQNSAYTVETDPNGRYVLAYAPGAFTVTFEKAGAVARSMQLNLATTAPFDAQPITLLSPEGARQVILQEVQYGQLDALPRDWVHPTNQVEVGSFEKISESSAITPVTVTFSPTTKFGRIHGVTRNCFAEFEFTDNDWRLRDITSRDRRGFSSCGAYAR